MGDVAADGDGQTFDAAFAAFNGQGVEQSLSRMLVRAVAGVDDGGVDFLGQQAGRARLGVADDQQVALHGVQGGGGVDQRLALVHG